VLEVLRVVGDAPHVLLGDLNRLAVDDPIGEPLPKVDKRGEAIDGVPRFAIAPLVEAG
jgi:hypothetical protein